MKKILKKKNHFGKPNLEKTEENRYYENKSSLEKKKIQFKTGMEITPSRRDNFNNIANYTKEFSWMTLVLKTESLGEGGKEWGRKLGAVWHTHLEPNADWVKVVQTAWDQACKKSVWSLLQARQLDLGPLHHQKYPKGFSLSYYPC